MKKTTKLGAHHNEREIRDLAEKLRAHCEVNKGIWKHVPTLSHMQSSPPTSAVWLDLAFLFSFLFLQEKVDRERAAKNVTRH
jgi:hypothetical protein